MCDGHQGSGLGMRLGSSVVSRLSQCVNAVTKRWVGPGKYILHFLKFAHANNRRD